MEAGGASTWLGGAFQRQAQPGQGGRRRSRLCPSALLTRKVATQAQHPFRGRPLGDPGTAGRRPGTLTRPVVWRPNRAGRETITPRRRCAGRATRATTNEGCPSAGRRRCLIVRAARMARTGSAGPPPGGPGAAARTGGGIARRPRMVVAWRPATTLRAARRHHQTYRCGRGPIPRHRRARCSPVPGNRIGAAASAGGMRLYGFAHHTVERCSQYPRRRVCGSAGSSRPDRDQQTRGPVPWAGSVRRGSPRWTPKRATGQSCRRGWAGRRTVELRPDATRRSCRRPRCPGHDTYLTWTMDGRGAQSGRTNCRRHPAERGRAKLTDPGLTLYSTLAPPVWRANRLWPWAVHRDRLGVRQRSR